MSSSEGEPLLAGTDIQQYGPSQSSPHLYQKRHIGIFSAALIIFNRIVGAGIFATPALVLGFSGSIGMALLLWVLGALIALAGMQVFIVWGTEFPRNGGEKNYLEYLFPHPRRLITSVYAAYASLLAWAAAIATIFGEYLCKALLNHEPSSELRKLASFASITFAFLLHGLVLRFGLRLQNLLGVTKLLIVLIIIATGYVAFRDGIPTESGLPPDRWRARKNFFDIWEGTSRNPNSLCIALYNVIFSFAGFTNVNYALSEVHNPARTIRIAGPLAVIMVATLYLLSNLAYFAGASKEEITNSGTLVVALLMRNIWGESIERWVDFGVALSTFGSILAVSFSQGRVNQELGKYAALPFSSFWASDNPCNAPLAGLGLHWFMCSLVIFFVPQGDVYTFVINLTTYPLTIVNATVSLGLIYLFFSQSSLSSAHRHHHWNHLSFYTLFCATFFGMANVFLFILPFMKPPPEAEQYKHLPYWIHVAGGWGVFTIGAIGWVISRWRGWN
ncbi:high affinity methionine permease [Macrolepiota fuliginosa MF-IS2]|uniref:High affinity methionine permease n=1 Tax=Macrolepiota fuliginosa MF-IS2 TaxID=1400762 RepID=A0A9P5X8U7_9AGAR|nr:high affinity methionine permease [Macrolepiota fuliginosa MF-IS2]